MSFKVGDEIYYMLICFEEEVKIYGFNSFSTDRIRVGWGKIKEIHKEDKVYITIYHHRIYFKEAYKTKQECIDAFKKRLDEL